MACGDGGRVMVGRWTREERAAEDDDEESVDNVRVRSCRGLRGSFQVGCTGRVATERADETDVRRCCVDAAMSEEDGDGTVVRELNGDVDK